MKHIIIATILSLILSLSPALAQEDEEAPEASEVSASSSSALTVDSLDDEGAPNDPQVNDRANACYEGGTLEGKCDSELLWAAGWYLIRFESGDLDRGDIPEWVAWILPPDEGGDEE